MLVQVLRWYNSLFWIGVLLVQNKPMASLEMRVVQVLYKAWSNVSSVISPVACSQSNTMVAPSWSDGCSSFTLVDCFENDGH